MKQRFLALVVALFVAPPAFATWSVIALDRASGTIVIASATCVPQGRFATFPAEGLKDIQAIVVPGIGVAAAQASVDRTRRNQKLIFSALQKGTPPSAILELLSSDPEIARRQFGILDMQGRSKGFSGSENRPSSLDVQGQVAGTEIVYSIQGNILASNEVVHHAARAFEAGSGTLADRVMAAMEAADAEGGDGRCTCETEPTTKAPCSSRTAHVAYLMQSEKDDPSGDSYNNGEYALFIDVTDENILPEEDANPVKTLRMRYDARKRR
ncbi:MAG: DUF1028 domain-containing protein [Vicinamibacteria bacterium]